MKALIRNLVACAAAIAISLGSVASTDADIMVDVDRNENWLGYMNVFDLPANGGAFQFGSGWGTADLTAVFGGGMLTLGPNTIGDPDPYWYQGGGGPGAPGNKIMEANMYVEKTGTLAGDTVVFEGEVLSNTFTSDHETWIYIKDFAPDYSSFTETRILAGTGAFSVSHVTDGDTNRHVQYGFQTIGVNVWATDVAPFGTVQIGTVPEPGSMAVIGLGALAFFTRRRR